MLLEGLFFCTHTAQGDDKDWLTTIVDISNKDQLLW